MRVSPPLGALLPAASCCQVSILMRLFLRRASPVLFWPFPPHTLSLAEATGSLCVPGRRRIPEVIILKMLKPKEWDSIEAPSCPMQDGTGMAPEPPGAAPATMVRLRAVALVPLGGRERREGKAGQRAMVLEKEGDEQICFIRRCISQESTFQLFWQAGPIL